MKTFTTYNLGCKVNAYEISALTSRLIELGYKEDNEFKYCYQADGICKK